MANLFASLQSWALLQKKWKNGSNKKEAKNDEEINVAEFDIDCFSGLGGRKTGRSDGG